SFFSDSETLKAPGSCCLSCSSPVSGGAFYALLSLSQYFFETKQILTTLQTKSRLLMEINGF
ncbi:hypothetical protein, partial [Spartinivicinus poritis]